MVTWWKKAYYCTTNVSESKEKFTKTLLKDSSY